MGKHGISLENLNTEVKPQEDFYEYACGGWIERNPMPDEFSSYGQFDVLREKARKQVQDLILNLQSDPASKEKDTVAQKICDIYNLGMDEKRLNREGASPLKPYMKELSERLDSNSFTQLIAWLHQGLDSSFFSSGVGPDPADSNKNIFHIGETGIGLGDRDFYLEDNETNRKILEAYELYVKKIMTLAGYSEEEALRLWKTVIKIETELARIKMTREQRRNPVLRHNIYSVESLQKEFPFIDWREYLKLMEVPEVESANVSSVEYMRSLKALIDSISKEELADFLVYNLVAEATSLLSDDFIDADFEMFGKVMSGQKEKKPRWKRAMGIPNSMFGEAVGELYVKKYFPKENKDYMLALVENLRKSLHKHISESVWMSEETKAKALEKLSQMGVKIGYPDKWKDYSEIKIDPEKSYFENVLAASKWFIKDNYKKLNKPVDKTEWHMTPQTVNAYYSPIVNEICFPAAILQPPFFDITADDSINYGAIGVVIGHEMTHGFDDQGRQFDKAGNLTDWWTAKDAEKFNQMAEHLVKQFDKVEIAPGVYANGRFTLGENIADQGGLRIAYTAFLDSQKKKGVDITSPEALIDGLDPSQVFYMNFANLWANNIREEEMRRLTIGDVHSLGKNRVNVSLKNITPFFQAFGISEGDPMFLPESEQVIIW